MTIKKDKLINAAIDLFAERDIDKVTMNMIAKKANVSRTDPYHHLDGGKDEIIDSILEIFDSIIEGSMPRYTEDTEIDAKSVLSNLFLAFSGEDAEKARKINRIIFANFGNDARIGKYLSETFYRKQGIRMTQLFNMLVAKGKLKPFDTDSAARILNRIFIAYALEDSINYPFENDGYEKFIEGIKTDCAAVINSILDGRFHV